LETCIDVPVELNGDSGTTVMWMAAPPPAGTTPGAASQVSGLVYVNDFSGYVNVCTSNLRQGQSVDRELIEISCEVLGSPQSDQASQSDQTPQSEQAENSGPSALAQRSCAWTLLGCSWHLLLAFAALPLVVVGVVQ
jgi:hypothetical protein